MALIWASTVSSAASGTNRGSVSGIARRTTITVRLKFVNKLTLAVLAGMPNPVSYTHLDVYKRQGDEHHQDQDNAALRTPQEPVEKDAEQVPLGLWLLAC